MTLHNWAKKGPNMGVAVPRALVGGWGPDPPQKFGNLSQIVGQLLKNTCWSPHLRGGGGGS